MLAGGLMPSEDEIAADPQFGAHPTRADVFEQEWRAALRGSGSPWLLRPGRTRDG